MLWVEDEEKCGVVYFVVEAKAKEERAQDN